MTQTLPPTARKSLRLWPGVLAAVLLVLLRFVIPVVVPDAGGVGVIAGLVGTLAIAIWWLFFSRAPWAERLGVVGLVIAAVIATRPLLDKSIATGMMGMMFVIYAVPAVLSPAFVAWAVTTRHLSERLRRASLVATILLACGVWTLLRTDGIIGSADAQLAWRWTKTPEQRLLSDVRDEPVPIASPPQAADASGNRVAGPSSQEEASSSPAPSAATLEHRGSAAGSDRAAAGPAGLAATKTDADWPGFRGRDRDAVVRGVRIVTDWAASPPIPLWRRPIGPGWSSVAVRGDLLYTQEQRGDDELVASYRVSSGEPVWRHRDAVRFWESNGGAGPRATPALDNDRVYTFGATGILNALDAANGALVWSRNVATDTHKEVPMWGFASSPLVVGDVVVVAAAGQLAAYDLATGHPRWVGPSHGVGYSSPHRTTIDGIVQILLLSASGATSVAPADGAVLWEHAWPGGAIVQPAVTAEGDVLINSLGATGGVGTRRLAIAHGPEGWSVKERWTSSGLKPYFNDLVVHKGHAFGFDGSILSCIDLETGARKWKGGRYGNGQLVLLSDQDLLLVLSEDGELALVNATPDGFAELARFPALDGKTWNHPVLIGDHLLVRNGQEMAAFRLSLTTR